jgi:transposase
MQDKELYQHILGLTSPSTVSEVKLNIPAEEILVRAEHPASTKICCPESQKELACYDHAEERRWWHLDSSQYKTILIGCVPRVDCPDHGVKNVTVPGALPHIRFTIMFERFAIEVLQLTKPSKEPLRLPTVMPDGPLFSISLCDAPYTAICLAIAR